MAAVTDEAIEVVERFLQIVKTSGIKIDRAILFGSYANGSAGKWSDIDIALVSQDFSGISFYDNKKLIPFLLKIDSRIEVHPFRPEDFNEDNLFAKEIIKNGVEIEI
jgi:predicted nucleotidyltransferase